MIHLLHAASTKTGLCELLTFKGYMLET